MDILEYLFVFDISAIAIMVFISHLSKRLGEALKIPSYYKILYFSALLVFCGFAVDTLGKGISIPRSELISVSIRLVAGICALIVALRYWKWLFAEFLKN